MHPVHGRFAENASIVAKFMTPRLDVPELDR